MKSEERLASTVQTNIDASNAKSRIVVVGGGLAGLAATLQAHDEAAKLDLPLEILLIEKTPRLGGNSAKASSGINALNPPAGDSQQLFESDTLSSGGGLSDEALVKLLVGSSPDAISFLTAAGLDLSKVTQLGGHSVPRSFSSPAGPNVGLVIMQALMRKVQQLPGVQVMEGTKLEDIIMDKGRVAGVRVLKSTAAAADGSEPVTERQVIPCAAVVLATGGFGANKAMLQEHNPTAAALATTNGDWAQGDALGIARAVGANVIHLEHVQIHPTGFVDPKDPDAGTKWLAPEKFRGVGALLMNSGGRRFVDELSTRDVVSEAMLSQPGQKAFMLLGIASATDFGIRTVDFYCSKGMMKKADSVADLADIMAVPEELLASELQAYNQAVEAKGDYFGKKVFPNSVQMDGPFYVGTVVPVVHYTMGGVQINGQAQVLDTAAAPIPGLFGAGEVTGGVHGRNRLGGNSLLECAVFGRIAGQGAAAFVMQP